MQRRRVELHELDIRRRHAGPQRHRDAVPGRLGRVGGDGKELARSTGSQHDMVGPDLDHGPCGGSAVTPTQRPPSMIRSRANHPSSTALAVR